ncbi:Outer membrane lipoprotein-sorting protein [hydrothermal vent metagenome]|uniref:Outer membrane lipoprotein-sorting protein n=1 Tax=hydrothermal vent metagenome TaxID=652676 RepID=A0A3B0ZEQ1_9ZZZZ
MINNRSYALILPLLAILLPATAFSIDDAAVEKKGLAIATETDLRDADFGDSSASLKMVLRNRHGETSERLLRNKTLEVTNDGDKVIIIFDTPRDVKGTAFLSFTHKLEPDDQWLYLPALKRVKRIASRNKAGPFMGSEFAYEDISSQEIEKYSYRYIKDETFDGRDHFIIERDPVDPRSGYKRQRVWIDKAEYRIWKIDFYDRKDSLLKTLSYDDYNQYLKKFWRANIMEMTNHQTGKSTRLSWTEFSFKNGFSEKEFTKNALKKSR